MARLTCVLIAKTGPMSRSARSVAGFWRPQRGVTGGSNARLTGHSRTTAAFACRTHAGERARTRECTHTHMRMYTVHTYYYRTCLRIHALPTHARICTKSRTPTHTHMHVCIHAHGPTYPIMHARTHLHTYAHMHACTHKCTLFTTYTWTHAYTHTHTLAHSHTRVHAHGCKDCI